MSDVKLFKLINGQEIVATYVGLTGQGHRISKPLAAHVMHGEGGVPTLGFFEWSMAANLQGEFELYNHALITEPLEPADVVRDSYQQQMSAILLPPSAGKILHG